MSQAPKLSGKMLQLLDALQDGRPASRLDLIAKIWADEPSSSSPTGAVLDTYNSRLDTLLNRTRRALSGHAEGDQVLTIENMRGAGFSLRRTPKDEGRGESARESPSLPNGGPYLLSDGVLQLDRLSELILNRHVTNPNGSRQLDLWFIFGSGMASCCNGHMGRVSDAVNTPEIATYLTRAFYAKHGDNAVVNVRSNYDIVLLPQLLQGVPTASERGSDLAFPHVFSFGFGDVNACTNAFAEHWAKQGAPIRPGPDTPSGSAIHTQLHTGRGRLTVQNAGHGWLCAAANPWVEDRLLICAAGVDGLGTMAASWALLRYLRDAGQERRCKGNNSLDRNVASRVVLGKAMPATRGQRNRSSWHPCGPRPAYPVLIPVLGS